MAGIPANQGCGRDPGRPLPACTANGFGAILRKGVLKVIFLLKNIGFESVNGQPNHKFFQKKKDFQKPVANVWMELGSKPDEFGEFTSFGEVEG